MGGVSIRCPTIKHIELSCLVDDDNGRRSKSRGKRMHRAIWAGALTAATIFLFGTAISTPNALGYSLPPLEMRYECKLSTASTAAVVAFANRASLRAAEEQTDVPNLTTHGFDWFAIFKANRNGVVESFSAYFQGYDKDTGRHMGTFDVDTSNFQSDLPRVRFARANQDCDFGELEFDVICEHVQGQSCVSSYVLPFVPPPSVPE